MKLNKLLPIVGSLCVGAITTPMLVCCAEKEVIYKTAEWKEALGRMETDEFKIETNVEYCIDFSLKSWGGGGEGDIPSPLELKVLNWTPGTTKVNSSFKINDEELEIFLDDTGSCTITRDFKRTDIFECSIEFTETAIHQTNIVLSAQK